jgi:hypothetical protein
MNLGFTLIAENQAQKYLAANTQIDEIDLFLTDDETLPVTATNAFTVSSLQFQRNHKYLLTAAGITASSVVTFPAIKRGLFLAQNTSGFDATLQIAGQPLTAPVLANDAARLFECDGVNVTSIKLDVPYDVAAQFGGIPPAGSTVFMRVTSSETYRLLAGLPGSQVYCLVTPSASTVFDLKKNGTSIGSVSIAGGSNTATFTFTSGVDFTTGDRFSIVAPAILNGIADIMFTFVAKRTS